MEFDLQLSFPYVRKKMKACLLNILSLCNSIQCQALEELHSENAASEKKEDAIGELRDQLHEIDEQLQRIIIEIS